MQGLKRKTPLKAKKGLERRIPLRARKMINPLSDKQRAKNELWGEITDERVIEENHICQWCHQRGSRLFPRLHSHLDGHHIVKRSQGRIDTPENCYIVHRFKCHGEIDDNNVDVQQYPNREVWLKNKEATNV